MKNVGLVSARWLKLCAIGVFWTMLCAASPYNGTATAIPAQTASHIAASAQALGRYQSSRSLNDLADAVTALDGSVDAASLTPSNFTQTRRALVASVVPILKNIEQAYDPTFNPRDQKNQIRHVSCACPDTQQGRALMASVNAHNTPLEFSLG